MLKVLQKPDSPQRMSATKYLDALLMKCILNNRVSRILKMKEKRYKKKLQNTLKIKNI